MGNLPKLDQLEDLDARSMPRTAGVIVKIRGNEIDSLAPDQELTEICNIPVEVLLRHAMEQMSEGTRGAVVNMELTVGATLVNLGMNIQTVAWRALMPDLRQVAETGVIPVWHGQIADFRLGVTH